MYQLRPTPAADTNTLPINRFKIQSTEPPNNHHIKNRISIASITPTPATDPSTTNSIDIKGNEYHIIDAETTPSIHTNDETTLYGPPYNNNYHDKIFNVRIPPTTKDFTPMTTTTSLLWTLLLITTITRAATLAIQGPVIKRGSTVCLVEETFNVFSGGQQFTTDEYPVRTWDVWLPGKQICIPADECIDNGMNDEEERVQHAKDKLQRVTQRTSTATVQLMVFESDSSDFDVEALVGSASSEVRSKGIQCRHWEAWLNSRTSQLCRANDRQTEGKKEDEKDGYQEELVKRVPQRTEQPMATVQLTVIKSEADYFEAEVPVCNAGRGVQLYEVFQGRCRPWDIWLRAKVQ